jgi:hypothetical protein
VSIWFSSVYQKIKALWAQVPQAWRFAILAVLLARFLLTLWSITVLNFFPQALQNMDLFGEPVVTIFDMQTSERYAYNRAVDGKLLVFQPAGTGFIQDVQTGSRWKLVTGTAIDGPLANRQLQVSKVPVERIFPYKNIKPAQYAWLAIWQHFDANWYLSIAQNGYGNFPDDTHFMPLYPALVCLIHFVIPDWMIAGLLVSLLSTIWLIETIYELFSEWGGRQIAEKGIFIFLIFPAAFFLFSAYAEPLFIVTSLLALRSMRANQWLLTSFWMTCAILSRVQGLALFLPLAYALWRAYGWRLNSAHVRAALFPILAVFAYLGLRFSVGAPSVLPINEPSVAAGIVWPWKDFIDIFHIMINGTLSYMDVINLFLTLLFFGLLVYGWKRIPIEYNLYTLACMLILITREVETQPFNPMIRYALTIIPAFYLLARLSRNRWIDRLVVFTSFAVGLFLSAQFFLWGWVA